MNCPRCDQTLNRAKYAGANTFACNQCRGHLIAQTRVRAIESRINKDLDGLQNEVVAAGEFDLQGKVKCPKCRGQMRKTKARKLEFTIDECTNCDFTWLDGGELAKIQLAFEAKDQTQELNRMRDRLNNMSDEERAEYQADIDRLVDLGSSLEQAISGAAIHYTNRQHY